MCLRSAQRGPVIPTTPTQQEPAQQEPVQQEPAQQNTVQEQPAQNIQQETVQRQTPECSGCAFQPINRVFIPCGHSFCNICTDRRTGNEPCYVCRAPVRSVFPLFF